MAMIGVSKPYVAVYSNTGSTVSYTGLTTLGKYTNLDLSLDDAGANDFYADNAIAESDNRAFAGGSLTITTSDLDPAALKTVLGLVEEAIAATVATTTPVPKWLVNGDGQQIPYVGIGGIVKMQINGEIKYQAIVLNKVLLRNPGLSIATQGETIEWQTPTIEGRVYRSDAADHRWRMVSTYLDSDADAIAAITAVLS